MFNNLPSRNGDAYFDALDAQIKSDNELLLTLVNKATYPIIASGGFGDALKQIDVTPTLHVSGGLRKSRTLDLSKWEHIIRNNTFTFIDDSYYKGRTLRKINQEIVRLGGHIAQVIVAYDDTCDMPFIESLYQRQHAGI